MQPGRGVSGPNDIQMAGRYDFPDLNFGLHHMGRPVRRGDDSASRGRFPNIHLMLPAVG